MYTFLEKKKSQAIRSAQSGIWMQILQMPWRQRTSLHSWKTSKLVLIGSGHPLKHNKNGQESLWDVIELVIYPVHLITLYTRMEAIK